MTSTIIIVVMVGYKSYVIIIISGHVIGEDMWCVISGVVG